MAVTHTEIVIPTRWDFLALFGVIGVGGFLAQVLLTMGLQREAAGRATLALYVGVSVLKAGCECACLANFGADHLRTRPREDIL